MKAPIWSDDKIVEALKGSITDRNQTLKYVFIKLNWKEMVINYILKNGGNETDAIEIANDTLIYFDRNIRNNRFKGNSSLKTYFMAIAKRQWWKQQQRKKHFDEFDPQKHDRTVENAEDYILKKERIQYLKLLAAKFGEKCKKVFQLIQLGYKGIELAKELGLENADMAKKTTYRCREKLRKYLKDNPA